MGMDLESGDLDANGSVWIACVKASLTGGAVWEFELLYNKSSTIPSFNGVSLPSDGEDRGDGEDRDQGECTSWGQGRHHGQGKGYT